MNYDMIKKQININSEITGSWLLFILAVHFGAYKSNRMQIFVRSRFVYNLLQAMYFANTSIQSQPPGQYGVLQKTLNYAVRGGHYFDNREKYGHFSFSIKWPVEIWRRISSDTYLPPSLSVSLRPEWTF